MYQLLIFVEFFCCALSCAWARLGPRTLKVCVFWDYQTFMVNAFSLSCGRFATRVQIISLSDPPGWTAFSFLTYRSVPYVALGPCFVRRFSRRRS